jgi:mannose-6-phosphate isomerase-like protein (cupin superfamily)
LRADHLAGRSNRPSRGRARSNGSLGNSRSLLPNRRLVTATGGYEIFLQQGPEDSGPPPHNHPWDESFYVVKGEIEFGIGPETMTARPGTLVHLPAGATHWFRFGRGGGEMISMTSRLGASRMFTDFDREIAPDKPDLDKLVAIAARHDAVIRV